MADPTATVVGRLYTADGEVIASGRVGFTPDARLPLTNGTVVESTVYGTFEGGDLNAPPLFVVEPITYEVVFRDLRTAGGERASISPFHVKLTAGQSHDLRDILPIARDGGSVIVVDPSAADRAEDAAGRAEAAAETLAEYASRPRGTEFVQAQPISTWTFPHLLGRRPTVTVYDGDTEIDTDVHATATAVTVIFPEPTAGSVVLS